MGHFADNVAQLVPVDLGHDQVKKHDIRIKGGQQVQRRKPVLRRSNFVAFLFQQIAREFQQHPIIVNQQNFLTHESKTNLLLIKIFWRIFPESFFFGMDSVININWT
jgi:hypothetical protein